MVRESRHDYSNLFWFLREKSEHMKMNLKASLTNKNECKIKFDVCGKGLDLFTHQDI
jgi:hypothetical protein